MSIGYWIPSTSAARFTAPEIVDACQQVREQAAVVMDPATRAIGVGLGGQAVPAGTPLPAGTPYYHIVGLFPAVYPEWLGDRSFLDAHKVRYPYIAGEMANAIASADMVIAMAKAQMLGFYGAGGVPIERVEADLRKIQAETDPYGLSWGVNLIHTPNEMEMEERASDLYLRLGVRRVCASAYMRITPAIVRYSCSGLSVDPSGRIVRQNMLLAKLSRPELATGFMSPAPMNIVNALVEAGKLTPREAELSQHVPLAEDITVEGDSGGHTDNRPLVSLLPTICATRDQLVAKYKWAMPIRVGAAGGLGTPGGIAAAFALGAAYVVTGSINQCTIEAGTSELSKKMLLDADIADVIMAPAPDMFEQGVKVQVLKRGTMFSGRGFQLYEIYKKYDSIEQIPTDIRERIEKEIFRVELNKVWEDTRSFFAKRNPEELAKAEKDPKHKMALVFRWYVGQTSRWAIAGDVSRRLDYQLWCGPAMGAFNAWVKGTFLQDLANRGVVQIAKNLMEGAAVVTRAQQLRAAGLAVPAEAFDFRPRPIQ